MHDWLIAVTQRTQVRWISAAPSSAGEFGMNGSHRFSNSGHTQLEPQFNPHVRRQFFVTSALRGSCMNGKCKRAPNAKSVTN